MLQISESADNQKFVTIIDVAGQMLKQVADAFGNDTVTLNHKSSKLVTFDQSIDLVKRRYCRI